MRIDETWRVALLRSAAWYGLVKEQAGMPLRVILRLALLRKDLTINKLRFIAINEKLTFFITLY
ncbi:hypothetical protein [Spirosoma spitsbergense]|uniref:hypothetical protein n=1 Tax=Spirosoma spitsbergense TaxID=431554 RepID=UPI0012FC75D2|nr:hypothetical protein [Spirosoma spitsbergense]